MMKTTVGVERDHMFCPYFLNQPGFTDGLIGKYPLGSEY